MRSSGVVWGRRQIKPVEFNSLAVFQMIKKQRIVRLRAWGRVKWGPRHVCVSPRKRKMAESDTQFCLPFFTFVIFSKFETFIDRKKTHFSRWWSFRTKEARPERKGCTWTEAWEESERRDQETTAETKEIRIGRNRFTLDFGTWFRAV